MKLPKIEYPTLTIKLPMVGKDYMFRPMLVKEEKLLLIAKVSEDETDILQSIKQVVNNCCLDPNLNVDNLTLLDLEYAFMRLRAFSIGEEVEVSYRDDQDDKVYDFKINIKDVTTRVPENDRKVMIGNDSGLVLEYPRAFIYDDKEFLRSTGQESIYKLIKRCVDQIFMGDEVGSGKDFSDEEITEFLEQLDIKTFDKIVKFVTELPSLYYKIEYKNSLGNDRKIELTTLSDFFTLR